MYKLQYVIVVSLCLASITSSAVIEQKSSSLAGDRYGRIEVWYHRLRRSSGSEETGNHTNSSEHHHNERFHVASINWRRVENPFIVCLWIVFAGLAKIGFRTSYMHKIVSRVPESCLLICLGLIVGGIAYAINQHHQIDKLLFNPDTFFLFILPPIVLEAGYFMPKEPFFENLGTILTYALIGTIFNAFAIGLSLYGVFSIGWMPGMKDVQVLECLLFGSIISAVDPVAVISVFEEIHVNIILYICVFGESLLNDGVAVVLYHTFEGFLELGGENLIGIDYFAAFTSFFVVVFGGLFLGIIYGYLGSFITKYTVNNRVIEPTFVFVLCYLAYLTAEIFHLSGIIAIVFAGFIMNSYVEQNISPKSHTTVKYGMKMLAGVCETIIFMLLGIAAVSDFWQYWNTGFVLWTVIFITVYRAIGVVVLTKILNYFRLEKINAVDQFVMAYGGLRGAIAFSLVSLTTPELVPCIKTMVCACIVCILFTSFVQGSTIRPIVDFLHVTTASEHKETMFEDINMRLIDHLMTGIEDCIGHKGHHYWSHKLTKFHTDYMQKWFVREPYKTHDEVILETFHRINKREAHAMLMEIERGGSYNELCSEKTLANLLLPTEMRRSFSTTTFNSMIKTHSEACIDLRAIEMQRQSPQVMTDDTLGDAHHLLKKNMYRPRVKTQTQYRRGEIEVSHNQRRQEQEILIRRRIHQRHKKHQKHRKHRHRGSDARLKPKNGSFQKNPNANKRSATVGPDQIQLVEQTINPLTGVVAPSVIVERSSPHDSLTNAVINEEAEEDHGITFTVERKDTSPVTENIADDIEVLEPEKKVALDKELPWRSDKGSAPVFDPRERSGSLHPHYFDEDEDDDDDEDDEGPSSNINNSSSKTVKADGNSFMPLTKPIGICSDSALDNKSNLESTRLLLEVEEESMDAALDILPFLKEDVV